jgi:hypothetical protein
MKPAIVLGMVFDGLCLGGVRQFLLATPPTVCRSGIDDARAASDTWPSDVPMPPESNRQPAQWMSQLRKLSTLVSQLTSTAKQQLAGPAKPQYRTSTA